MMKFEEKFIILTLTTGTNNKVAIDLTEVICQREETGGFDCPKRTVIEFKTPGCSVVVKETLEEIQAKWNEMYCNAKKNEQKEVQD